MRRLHKWSIVGASGAFTLLVVAVLIISWIAGQGLIRPSREVSGTTPSDVGLSWSWANFTTEDDVAVVGWWMPTDGTPEDNVTVIFLHGYGDSKNQSLEAAPFLVRAGHNLLAFDFRASGESGGDYTTAGIYEIREVRAAVGWVKRQQGFPEDPRLVLFGWSMGGATAIRAAAGIEEVDAVIADGAYSRLQHIVDTSIVHFIEKAIGFSVPRWPIGPLSVQFASWSIGVALDEDPPTAAIGRLGVPVLLIQGAADTTVVPSNVEELANAGGERVTVVLVPDAPHVGSFRADSAAYEATVLRFLAGAFQPS